MERPEWIGAALERGRGGLTRVRGLFGRGDSAETAETVEAEPKAAMAEPKKPEPATADPKKPEKPEPEPAAEQAGPEQAGPGLVARVRERPTLAIAAAALALLVVVWIAWAIHVGSTNGGDAAVGVLITWPLVFLVVANLVLIGLGLTMLFRYLQPSDDEPGDEGTSSEKTADA